jgi:hypothetical protein
MLPAFHIDRLSALLETEGIDLWAEATELIMRQGTQTLRCQLLLHGREERSQADFVFPLDLLIHKMPVFVARCKSLLRLNTVIYARQCLPKKIDKETAAQFLNAFHLMGATASARQYGLFYQDQLLCVATYSAGRKMNRLPASQRSYELIRFCTRSGYTVTGGLSRLLRQFIRDHQPGDIMTYVDTQLFSGSSYQKAGFKIISKSEAHWFQIKKSDFTRKLCDAGQSGDSEESYFFTDEGNTKLILTCEAQN